MELFLYFGILRREESVRPAGNIDGRGNAASAAVPRIVFRRKARRVMVMAWITSIPEKCSEQAAEVQQRTS
jgi:hypothetical protein